MIAAQFLTTGPALVSIFLPSAATGYTLALVSFLFFFVYLMMSIKYAKKRSAANLARRYSILTNGLGVRPSANEAIRIRQYLAGTKKVCLANMKPDYYGSREDFGYARLVEIVGESAFYTKDLQRLSGSILYIGVGTIVSAFFVWIFLLMPDIERSSLISLIQAVLIFLIAAMSNEIFVSAKNHVECSRACDDVFRRSQHFDPSAVDAQFCALAILEDYTSAVESSQEPLPFIYRICAADLENQWSTYTQERGMH